MEDKVRLICVKLKPNETPDKVKAKVLKSLRTAERRHLQPCSLSHPLGVSTLSEEACSIAELNAGVVSQVVTNSKYIVFLLKDGSVCRMKCASREETRSKLSTDVFRRPNQPKTSFQVLSDAEYARQLQAQFDSERGRGGQRGWAGRGAGTGGVARRGSATAGGLTSGSTASTEPTVNFNDLDRQSRELMFLGSVPSPEFNSDPDYYRNLARNLSYCDIRIEDVGPGSPQFSPPSPPAADSDFYIAPPTPPPAYNSLSFGTLRLVLILGG